MTEYSSLFEKYAHVKDIQEKTVFLNDSLQRKVEILTDLVIHWKEVAFTNKGRVTIDTVYINGEQQIVTILDFSDSNELFSYTDTIIVSTPPQQKFSIRFNPFKLSSKLVSDEQGRLSTVLELKGLAREFLEIQSMETVIDESFWNKYTQRTVASLDMLLIGGLSANPEVYLHFGAGASLGDNLFMYVYGTNSSHQLLYGRRFNLW